LLPIFYVQADGDLLPQELNDVWDAATTTSDDKLRIDFDSFLQVYRDIDDMFEDDDDDEDDTKTSTFAVEERSEDDDGDDEEEEVEFTDTIGMDSELVAAFESLANNDGLVSKDALKSWDEVTNLLDEGLLGRDEFESIWKKTPKSVGHQDEFLDSDGFLAFNVALDNLFDFAEGNLEDEEDVGVNNEEPTPVVSTPRAMVEESDLPPGVLFANLADDNEMVGMEELALWVELREMLEEGDLLQSELQDMYDRLAPSKGKLDEEAFLRLYNEIDNLFEEEGDDEGGDDESFTNVKTDSALDQAKKVKSDLCAFLEIIQEGGDDVLPCGLDASESDQKQVVNIVKALEMQPSNMIKQKQGNIEMSDLTGNWELLYSSSSAMKFNKGLSGLGGSFPNGRFNNLKQKFTVTKVFQDMEYIERIEVNPSSASFDVSVPGSWNLRKSVSLFSGESTIVVELQPERVNYGPTSMRADHWKSLGPMNMLDLTYLDENLRVMRGCTSADTLFIWKRIDEDR
jgi:PAP_fibrillin